MGIYILSLSLTFISVPSTAAPNLQALFHLLDEPALFPACFQSHLGAPYRLMLR
jgi:hypothetical protein